MTKNVEFAYWWGPEVEGRLSGINTIFIRTLPEPHFLLELDDVQHIYLTNYFVNMAENADWDEIVDAYEYWNVPITIEVDNDCLDLVPARIRNFAHILLRLKSTDALRLKPTDSIAIDGEIYNCLVATKYTMQSVSNEAYQYDHSFVRV